MLIISMFDQTAASADLHLNVNLFLKHFAIIKGAKCPNLKNNNKNKTIEINKNKVAKYNWTLSNDKWAL